MPTYDVGGVLDELREVARANRPVGDVPHPRQRDVRDIEDSNYRKAYGINGRKPFGAPLRAAFYAYLPDVPLTRHLPADFARNYLAQIHRVQEMQQWSRRECERLRVLERRWSRRASGLDARYNEYGTAPGRTNRDRDPRANPRDRIDAICHELRKNEPAAPLTPFGVWKPKGRVTL